MQVSINWLKDYVNINCTADELAEKFTMAGIPVENVIRAGEGLEKVVTGRIEQLTAHPDSDHLQVCQMNIGGDELLQIVTGAPNVKQGQVVVGRCAFAQRSKNFKRQTARRCVKRYVMFCGRIET